MKDVIDFCCEFLFSWLDNDNIIEVEMLANLYGLDQLGEKVHSYLLKNIHTFSRTSVYRQLPAEKVLLLLSSDDLEVNSEKEVFDAALHYHYSPELVDKDLSWIKVRELFNASSIPVYQGHTWSNVVVSSYRRSPSP